MITRWLAASLFFVGLVAAWHVAVKAQIWSPLLLPSPASVLEYLRTAAQDGTLWEATLVTVRRLLIGYGLGHPRGSSTWAADRLIPLVP